VSEELWLLGLRTAGVLHGLTLVLACFTPVPRDWAQGLAALSPVHRRFALAQNAAVGAVLLFLGYVSLIHPEVLLEGSTAGRLLAAATALWWGGRLLVLPWLGAHRELGAPLLRVGFAALCAQCLAYAVLYGMLALRVAPGLG
jgi:hypothetical protein